MYLLLKSERNKILRNANKYILLYYTNRYQEYRTTLFRMPQFSILIENKSDS